MSGTETTNTGNPLVVAGVYHATPPTLADGQGTALEVNSSGALITASSGSTAITASGAALTATGSSLNVNVTSSAPGQWSTYSTPAVATQATCTQAAVAGKRHYCTSISFTLAVAATAQATVLSVSLRDGATGAGTVLWSKQAVVAVSTIWEVNLSSLNIVGSINTAMTLEFSGPGVTTTFESVAMTGYDA